MFRYIQSEPTLWTVGTGSGKDWNAVSDHPTEDEARAECAYLNGGPRPNCKPAKSFKIEKQDLRKSIERILLDGIMNAEEVDVTTEKVLNEIWPIIEYLKEDQP